MREALFVIDVPVGSGDRDDLGPEFRGLRGGAPGDVPESGDGDGLALDVHPGLFEHLAQEIDGAETGGLGTDQRTSVGHALSGQDAGIFLGEFAVHAVEESDFAASDADITGRDIGFGTDVPPEFGHEGLAEAHDLAVGLAFGVEVRAALGAAHGERGEGVLEDLLEAEELEDREVDRGVETQSALVGADGVVELDTVADIGLYFALVVYPYDFERKDAVGFDDPFRDTVGLEFGVLVVGVFDGHQHFAHGLEVFAFTGVFAFEVGHDFVNVHSTEVFRFGVLLLQI